MKKATPFTFYFLYYSAAACLTPYIVLYFQELGFGGLQIGILVATAPLLTLIGAPLWTWMADSTGSHRQVMSLAILVAIFGTIIFPFLKTLIPVLIAVAAINLFVSTINPMADSATMAMLAGKKEMYGRVRLGGSIGYGLAAPLAGFLIQAQGLRWAFWGFAVLMSIGLFVSQGFIHPKSANGKFLDGGAWSLLASSRWTLFLVVAFICGMCFAATSNYLFPFMAELQATKPIMGLSLTLATLSELPVLFFANRLIRWLHAYGLLLLGLCMTALRMVLFAVFNSIPAVLIIQLLLQGLTFPAVWAAGVSYADENAPAGYHATAQGLFGAMVFGFGAVAGSFTGGVLLESLGARSMYLVIGMFALLCLSVIFLIGRRQLLLQNG